MTLRDRTVLIVIVVLFSAAASYAQRSVLAPSVPSGTVAFVDTGNCPGGYTEETLLRGRHLVGVPASGTVGGTLGTAQTDLQDAALTLAQLPAHAHQQTVQSGALATLASAVGTGIGDTGTGGGAADNTDTQGSGSNVRSSLVPYAQLKGCKRS